MGRVGNKRSAPGNSGGASKKAKTKANTRAEEKGKGKGKGKGRETGRPRKVEVAESSESLEEDEEGDGGEEDLLEALSQSQSPRSEDSEGMESTRQLLKKLQGMVEKTNKKDNFQKEFEKEIYAEEKRLLGLLDELERERRSEREAFRNEFSSLLEEALSPTGINNGEMTHVSSASSSPSSSASIEETGTIKSPALDEHPIYVASRTLMEDFKAMVTEYDELTRKTAHCEPPEDFSEVWEKDYAEVRRLISVGRRATESEIDRLLTYEEQKGRRYGGKRKSETDADEFEKDEHLQAMLKMGREGQDGEKKVYGWGNAAHRLEKGFRRLVRALPDED